MNYGVAMITFERFEMTRLCALAVLLFAKDRERFLVLDDCSTDPRMNVWFRSLRDSGVLEFHQEKKNRGAGRMRQWLGCFCANVWPEYLICMDADMLIGPATMGTLLRAYRHWEDEGKTPGVLSCFGMKVVPEPDGKEFQLLDRYCDIGLFALRGDLYAQYSPLIRAARRRTFIHMTHRMRKDGYRRALNVSPQAPVANLGCVDATIGRYPHGKPGTYWGVLPPLNPLPELFDPEGFRNSYPDSAVALYMALRMRNEDRELSDALTKADNAVMEVTNGEA